MVCVDVKHHVYLLKEGGEAAAAAAASLQTAGTYACKTRTSFRGRDLSAERFSVQTHLPRDGTATRPTLSIENRSASLECKDWIVSYLFHERFKGSVNVGGRQAGRGGCDDVGGGGGGGGGEHTIVNVLLRGTAGSH